jgi:DNA polymerase I
VSQAAWLCARRELLALSVVASNDDVMTPPSQVVLWDGHDSAVLEPPAFASVGAWLADKQRVFAMSDAKPTMRRLLAAGLDVARPLCATSVATVVAAPLPMRAAARTIDAALAEAQDTWQRLPTLVANVESTQQKRVARLECMVLRAFAAMEHRGLAIRPLAWRALVEQQRQRASQARAEFLTLAGTAVARDLFGEPDFRIESDSEVKALLSRLTGRALEDVSGFTLRQLNHPVGNALLAWREAQKVVSTYGDSFLAHVHPVTKRLHANFVPLGAATGRVACRDPNLQNLPSGDDFHACLLPAPSRALVVADYGTCELRIVAQLSGDPVFRAAFLQQEDLHSTVATTLFGVPVSKTENAHLRHRAKGINFGLVYGMGPAGLAASLGIDRGAAEELLSSYFQRFPRIRGYLEGSVDEALRKGYSETMLGRRLAYDFQDMSLDQARGHYGRIMKNMPIQGTSADMTKLAMVRVHERLQAAFAGSAGLVNCVHDELVVECDKDDAAHVLHLVQEEMSEAHRTLLPDIPPAVDAGIQAGVADDDAYGSR